MTTTNTTTTTNTAPGTLPVAPGTLIPLADHVAAVIRQHGAAFNAAADQLEDTAASCAARMLKMLTDGLSEADIDRRKADFLAGLRAGAMALRDDTAAHVAARLEARGETDEKKIAKAVENRRGKVKKALADAAAARFSVTLEWDASAKAYTLSPVVSAGDKLLTATAKKNAAAAADRQLAESSASRPERDVAALETASAEALAAALVQRVGAKRAAELVKSAALLASNNRTGSAAAGGDGQPG